MAPGILALISAAMRPVSEIIKKSGMNKTQMNQIHAEMEKAKGNIQLEVVDLIKQEKKHQRDLIITEMNGNWMQRNWRPAFSWVVIAIIFNNYILLPYINIIFGAEVPITDIPEHIWYLFSAAFTGYIISRGYEKSQKMKQIGAAVIKKTTEIIDVIEDTTDDEPENEKDDIEKEKRKDKPRRGPRR